MDKTELLPAAIIVLVVLVAWVAWLVRENRKCRTLKEIERREIIASQLAFMKLAKSRPWRNKAKR